MKPTEFSVLGPLMGGFGSQAFLGCLHADDGLIKPAVMVFLPDEIVDSPDLFRRVWQETELGSQIDHVNVIGVMGLARLDEGYARVVEYADAESLRSVYRRATTLKKPIPPAIACTIVADACMGVHYAHELGTMETGEPMIHGGIRPETLQVSFKGMGKVTGYGATTIAEVQRKNRGTENVKDAYGAPEQSYGGRSAATVQTDVYALGCCLYEALTGKAPFAADNDLAEAMIRDELSRPQYEGVTDSMAMIVLKATRKKSAERYATALEMRHEIMDKCEIATELEIRRFMDELFPPDTVPRSTRDQMLIAAREKPPSATGKLLTAIPPELAKPTKSRSALPSDAEIEAAVGTHVEITPVHQKAPAPAGMPPPRSIQIDGGLPSERADPTAEHDIHNAETRPPQSAIESSVSAITSFETAPTVPVAAALPTEPAEKQRAVRSGPAPAVSSPPSWKANPTMPPTSPTGAVPQPQYPPYQSQPPVVYRSSPVILVALGACGALAIALVVYVVTKSDEKPPPQIIVQQPLPPPPPPPVEPPIEPIKPVAPTTTKTGRHVDDMDDRPTHKSEPPAPAGPGKIVVSTDPGSMSISIDGTDVGVGKATWEGKSGSHKIVARDRALGATTSRTVKLKAGETLEVDLAAEKGGLTFDQLADGLEVFVDGKKIGKTPMAAIQLYAGPHKVVVKKGTAEVSLNATIVAQRELFITATFQ